MRGIISQVKRAITGESRNDGVPLASLLLPGGSLVAGNASIVYDNKGRKDGRRSSNSGSVGAGGTGGAGGNSGEKPRLKHRKSISLDAGGSNPLVYDESYELDSSAAAVPPVPVGRGPFASRQNGSGSGIGSGGGSGRTAASNTYDSTQSSAAARRATSNARSEYEDDSPSAYEPSRGSNVGGGSGSGSGSSKPSRPSENLPALPPLHRQSYSLNGTVGSSSRPLSGAPSSSSAAATSTAAVPRRGSKRPRTPTSRAEDDYDRDHDNDREGTDYSGYAGMVDDSRDVAADRYASAVEPAQHQAQQAQRRGAMVGVGAASQSRPQPQHARAQLSSGTVAIRQVADDDDLFREDDDAESSVGASGDKEDEQREDGRTRFGDRSRTASATRSNAQASKQSAAVSTARQKGGVSPDFRPLGLAVRRGDSNDEEEEGDEGEDRREDETAFIKQEQQGGRTQLNVGVQDSDDEDDADDVDEDGFASSAAQRRSSTAGGKGTHLLKSPVTDASAGSPSTGLHAMVQRTLTRTNSSYPAVAAPAPAASAAPDAARVQRSKSVAGGAGTQTALANAAVAERKGSASAAAAPLSSATSNPLQSQSQSQSADKLSAAVSRQQSEMENLSAAVRSASDEFDARTQELEARLVAAEQAAPGWRQAVLSWVQEYEHELSVREAEWMRAREREVRREVAREVKKRAMAYDARLVQLDAKLRQLEHQSMPEMLARWAAGLFAFAWNGGVLLAAGLAILMSPLRAPVRGCCSRVDTPTTRTWLSWCWSLARFVGSLGAIISSARAAAASAQHDDDAVAAVSRLDDDDDGNDAAWGSNAAATGGAGGLHRYKSRRKMLSKPGDADGDFDGDAAEEAAPRNLRPRAVGVAGGSGGTAPAPSDRAVPGTMQRQASTGSAPSVSTSIQHHTTMPQMRQPSADSSISYSSLQSRSQGQGQGAGQTAAPPSVSKLTKQLSQPLMQSRSNKSAQSSSSILGNDAVSVVSALSRTSRGSTASGEARARTAQLTAPLGGPRAAASAAAIAAAVGGESPADPFYSGDAAPSKRQHQHQQQQQQQQQARGWTSSAASNAAWDTARAESASQGSNSHTLGNGSSSAALAKARLRKRALLSKTGASIGGGTPSMPPFEMQMMPPPHHPAQSAGPALGAGMQMPAAMAPIAPVMFQPGPQMPMPMQMMQPMAPAMAPVAVGALPAQQMLPQQQMQQMQQGSRSGPGQLQNMLASRQQQLQR